MIEEFQAEAIQARGRSVRRRVLLGLLVLIVGLSAASGIFIANYQPLAEGSARMPGQCVRELGEFSPFDGSPFRVWEVSCLRAGDRVTWNGSVMNDGPVAVILTGTPLEGQGLDHLGPISAWYGEIDWTVPRSADLKPLRRVSISPGESILLELRAELRSDCTDPSAGGNVTISALEIAFKVGPFTRRDHLGVLPQLRIPSCPT